MGHRRWWCARAVLHASQLAAGCGFDEARGAHAEPQPQRMSIDVVAPPASPVLVLAAQERVLVSEHDVAARGASVSGAAQGATGDVVSSGPTRSCRPRETVVARQSRWPDRWCQLEREAGANVAALILRAWPDERRLVRCGHVAAPCCISSPRSTLGLFARASRAGQAIGEIGGTDARVDASRPEHAYRLAAAHGSSTRAASMTSCSRWARALRSSADAVLPGERPRASVPSEANARVHELRDGAEHRLARGFGSQYANHRTRRRDHSRFSSVLPQAPNEAHEPLPPSLAHLDGRTRSSAAAPPSRSAGPRQLSRLTPPPLGETGSRNCNASALVTIRRRTTRSPTLVSDADASDDDGVVGDTAHPCLNDGG